MSALKRAVPPLALVVLLGIPLGLASAPSSVIGVFPPVERATIAYVFVLWVPIAFVLSVAWLSFSERRGEEDDASPVVKEF